MLLKGAYCVGEHFVAPQNAPYTICSLEVHIVYPAYTICGSTGRPLSKLFINFNSMQNYD